MTVNLYMTWETPYLPAAAGLTVEAWPASDFAHSPVGNPSAYPPAPSPTATTTTDVSGHCELTGLTAATDYYISIIDENNQPWFQFCPAAYLGNLSTSRRRWSINQGPVPVAPSGIQEITASGGAGGPIGVSDPTGPVTLLTSQMFTQYSALSDPGAGVWVQNAASRPQMVFAQFDCLGGFARAVDVALLVSYDGTHVAYGVEFDANLPAGPGSDDFLIPLSVMVPAGFYWQYTVSPGSDFQFITLHQVI